MWRYPGAGNTKTFMVAQVLDPMQQRERMILSTTQCWLQYIPRSNAEKFLFKCRCRILSDSTDLLSDSVHNNTAHNFPALEMVTWGISIWDEGKTHCLKDSQNKPAWGKATDSYHQSVLLLPVGGLLLIDVCSGPRCWEQHSPPHSSYWN